MINNKRLSSLYVPNNLATRRAIFPSKSQPKCNSRVVSIPGGFSVQSNPKNLDPSYRTDLDFSVYFGGANFRLIAKERG